MKDLSKFAEQALARAKEKYDLYGTSLRDYTQTGLATLVYIRLQELRQEKDSRLRKFLCMDILNYSAYFCKVIPWMAPLSVIGEITGGVENLCAFTERRTAKLNLNKKIVNADFFFESLLVRQVRIENILSKGLEDDVSEDPLHDQIFDAGGYALLLGNELQKETK